MKKDFESRFMPYVKFLIPKDMIDKSLLNVLYFNIPSYCISSFPVGAVTSITGYTISVVCNSIDSYKYFDYIQEVSIYEAMPELIPEGMRYNKELDKLVPNVVSAANEYCSGIKIEFDKVADSGKQEENISCKNEKSKHYEIWKDFEAIDVLKNCLTKDEFIGFLKGNILKYQLRLGKKDDVSKEIEKIKDYQNELNFILKELEKNAK